MLSRKGGEVDPSIAFQDGIFALLGSEGHYPPDVFNGGGAVRARVDFRQTPINRHGNDSESIYPAAFALRMRRMYPGSDVYVGDVVVNYAGRSVRRGLQIKMEDARYNVAIDALTYTPYSAQEGVRRRITLDNESDPQFLREVASLLAPARKRRLGPRQYGHILFLNPDDNWLMQMKQVLGEELYAWTHRPILPEPYRQVDILPARRIA